MRPISAGLWLLAVVFTAAMVHLSSVLLVPRLATEDSFSRVARLTRSAAPTVLPRPGEAGDSGLPFRDPAVSSALCRYDLSAGALRVEVPVGDGDVTVVSFHDRFGTSFYGLTDRSAVDGRLDVLLMGAAEARAVKDDDDAELTREVKVEAPTREGFVLVDILPRLGDKAAALRTLASVRCEVERGP